MDLIYWLIGIPLALFLAAMVALGIWSILTYCREDDDWEDMW